MQSTVQAEQLTRVSSSTYLQWLLPTRSTGNCGAHIQLANGSWQPHPNEETVLRQVGEGGAQNDSRQAGHDNLVYGSSRCNAKFVVLFFISFFLFF